MLKKKEYDIEYYKEKLQKCRETEAETLINMGSIYYDEENYNKALECFNEAIELYGELGSKEGEAFVLDLIGDSYLSKRDIQQALKYYNESFKLYSATNPSLKNEMFEKIKEVERIQEAVETVKDKKEYNISSEIQTEEDYVPDYEKIGTKLESVIKLLESANAYEAYSKEENPMKHLEEILNTSREIGDMKGEAIALLMMGDILLKHEKTTSALKYFNKAYDIFHVLDDKKGEGISLVLIGTLYFILGDMDKVSPNFRNAIEIFRKLNDERAESVTIDLLNMLY